ncbi:MAG: DUF4127 family protein [Acidaminococcales bacterium]|jgi:hypothetical protein|nr:DUF4127 family protein [Acidaminococcales bacterium]
MNVFLRIALLIFFLLPAAAAAAEKIIFVPMDDRPVNLSYAEDILKSAGWEIVSPPAELLASRYKSGDPDKLMAWLEEQSRTASSAVVAADALIYGGLVASRTHDYAADVLNARAERLIGLKNRYVYFNLYVFGTIMRTPRSFSKGTEPPYYEEWGADIFRLSALEDKEGIRRLSRREKAEKRELLAKIPARVRGDWLNRRALNFGVNKLLLAAAEGAFDYFALGRDDTAPFSQSRKEARLLAQESAAARLYNYRSFPGADQLGLLLLTRAVLDRRQYIPFVYVEYAGGAGRETVPSYEDAPVGLTVNDHIYAVGGMPVRTAERADLAFFINTPQSGATLEAAAPENTAAVNGHAQSFIELIKKQMRANKKAAIADVEFGNGASNALVAGICREGLSCRIDAYAGWNTAGNSIGYALGQGLLAPYMEDNDRERLLAVRYMDDWAYQANVRGALYRDIVWPRGLDGSELDKHKEMLAAAALTKMTALARAYLPQSGRYRLTVDFPWNRLFELAVVLKNAT